MSEETNKTEETVQEPTPEQIKAMRTRMKTFYKEEIQMLKIQEEHSRLQADIEEHAVRKHIAMGRMAQMHAAAEEHEAEYAKQMAEQAKAEEPASEHAQEEAPPIKKKRVLKKTE